ncbi:MAG: DUF479 domain-containing protein [Bacteroidetes bacterium]|uniref:DUF479 domain-containing protein n=1 Tax=Phaeocystidibacter marisrubri TaxID=1577780 RepID=A0A6L3ZGG3_9FLAO|nr:acyl carrier protein phosphodiesterase [Phaeocystidibacter marisrubri]KAB2816029.1 DUF479 domain-containing protein [Phaeocystidibacter marisrubri]TNE27887.1 MAG: DUF479 domain-containing protein [Bacteroidota bacterium]GGH66972.1 ACP phosphodiesterase [Phaeocystidibacter marisrubri]
MNFLAHLYLSFDDREVAIGNFVADSVKGEGLPHHSARIKTGIALHRAIDDFTDHHDIVRLSKQRLFPRYSHYSAVLVDIFYDHFLALNWKKWHNVPLRDFAHFHYEFFRSRKEDLPKQVQHMLPYMIQYDWLTNYAKFEGMKRVLGGMSRRASFNSKMEKAVEELHEFHAEFQSEFNAFFPQLIDFSKSKLDELKNNEE